MGNTIHVDLYQEGQGMSAWLAGGLTQIIKVNTGTHVPHTWDMKQESSVHLGLSSGHASQLPLHTSSPCSDE